MGSSEEAASDFDPECPTPALADGHVFVFHHHTLFTGIWRDNISLTIPLTRRATQRIRFSLH